MAVTRKQKRDALLFVMLPLNEMLNKISDHAGINGLDEFHDVVNRAKRASADHLGWNFAKDKWPVAFSDDLFLEIVGEFVQAGLGIDLAEEALKLPCPDCSARIGRMCKGPRLIAAFKKTGNKLKGLHSHRLQRAALLAFLPEED